MQLIIGTLLDVTSRERTWPSGDKTIEHTAHILDGVRTEQVTLQNPGANGPGLNPESVRAFNGQRIALETYSRGGNNKRVYLTGTALVSESDLADALGIKAPAKSA